jgi:hypothetical protein
MGEDEHYIDSSKSIVMNALFPILEAEDYAQLSFHKTVRCNLKCT